VVVGLLNYALQYIPAGRAALIFATAPLLTMLIATGLGYERITAAKVVGVLLTVLGVALALGVQVLQPGTTANSWIGELAVLGSAFSAATCSVLYRKYLGRYPALQISALAMLASVLFLVCLAAPEGFFSGLPHLNTVGWLAVIYMGLGSGLGYYLWLWALGRTTPTRVTVFLAFSPLTATFLGAVVLSEAVSLAAIGGLICVVIGLWLVHWQV
jgi:drug/metabolite transporter (DMT)-like permease